MKFYFILLTLSISNSLSAGTLPAKVDLSGRIVDADFDEPLEFATVSAFNMEELLVTGAITDRSYYRQHRKIFNPFAERPI